MRATAIIPVKRFGAAKQRLLEALDRPGRAALVRAMLADVLAATAGAELTERVIVVTGERRAERIALRRARRATQPLEVLRDPQDIGHSEAATLGIVRAQALGASCVALLPGDCPLLDPAELDAALERMRSGRVAIVPDRHGTGTNALLLSPPNAIGPAFGPDSCDPSCRSSAPRRARGRHRAARLAGARRRHPRRPRGARRGAGASASTAPPRRPPSWRDWVGSAAWPRHEPPPRGRPGARPAGDRHRRPPRRADRRTARRTRAWSRRPATSWPSPRRPSRRPRAGCASWTTWRRAARRGGWPNAWARTRAWSS